VSAPAASGRLVRSFLRYLKERVGEAQFEAVGAKLAPAEAALLHAAPHRTDWIPLATWQPVLEAFERRFGDLATWRLIREATRSTMAVAISKAWSTFLADATPELLLERADTFWKMSYNAGTLTVAVRKPRRIVLALDGWPRPPEPVVAMVAEACAVFLARLGEREPHAIDRLAGERAEVDVTW
jgi:hypothetical protein